MHLPGLAPASVHVAEPAPPCPRLPLPGVECGGLDRVDGQGKGRGRGLAVGTGRMQGPGLSIRKGPILKVP